MALAIACPFARIHETNLKKQGMLLLVFDDNADCDRLADGDRISLIGVEDGELRSGKQVMALHGAIAGISYHCRYSEYVLRLNVKLLCRRT